MPVTQRVSLASGAVLVAIAISPPMDRMADELFAAHMVQHLLLGLVAPLLIVAGRPLATASSFLEPRARRELLRMGGRVRRALGVRRHQTAWALAAVGAHTAAFWLWHVPALYDAAVRTPVLHVAEHASFFVTGLAFWWMVLAVTARNRSGIAVLYLFVAGLPAGALAALLTLTPHAIYQAHIATAARWHLTPLEDQQLAGGIMWVPGGLVYVIAAVVLFLRWLQRVPVRPALSAGVIGGPA